LIYVAATT
jgi:ribonuclease HI